MRPPFKAKFRNAEARPLIEKIMSEQLGLHEIDPQ